MAQIINIYCDESGHLEHDHELVMVLGAIKCPLRDRKRLCDEIRSLKTKHGLAPDFEVKWVKVSPAKLAFYIELVDLFFRAEGLSFRALVADKSQLNHSAFGQDHDSWYYKMYYLLLRELLHQSGEEYRIYIDVKDTLGRAKIRELKRILCAKIGDWTEAVIPRMQTLSSRDVELMQLSDLFIGAVGYVNRNRVASHAKLVIAGLISERAKLNLTHDSPRSWIKFNVFHWSGREV